MKPASLSWLLSWLLSCLLFLLCSPCVAQTNVCTSPNGLLSKDGGIYSFILGGLPSARFQFGDGEVVGNKMVLTQVDYRLQRLVPYDIYMGSGRSWKSVTLDMATCDAGKMSPTYTLNVLSTPTRVFSSAVTWATVSGLQASNPWGKQVSFPFTTPFAYDGKADMLYDYQFNGGTLANRFPWGASTYQLYYLDGVVNEEFSGALAYQQVPVSPVPCFDAAQNTAAYPWMYATTYGDKYATASLAGKVHLYHESTYTAPSAAFLHALALNGTDKGVNVGARCSNLHLDAARLILIVAGTAGSGQAYSGRFNYYVPYDSAMGGLKIWFQGAWGDSRTKALSLTPAFWVVVPPKPFRMQRASVYPKGSSNVVSDSGYRHTLPRLTKK